MLREAETPVPQGTSNDALYEKDNAVDEEDENTAVADRRMLDKPHIVAVGLDRLFSVNLKTLLLRELILKYFLGSSPRPDSPFFLQNRIFGPAPLLHACEAAGFTHQQSHQLPSLQGISVRLIWLMLSLQALSKTLTAK